MPSFPVVTLELSDAEREQLESWSRRWTTAHALAQRSKIVVLVADGLRTGEIAARLCTANTVAKWRRRFEGISQDTAEKYNRRVRAPGNLISRVDRDHIARQRPPWRSVGQSEGEAQAAERVSVALMYFRPYLGWTPARGRSLLLAAQSEWALRSVRGGFFVTPRAAHTVHSLRRQQPRDPPHVTSGQLREHRAYWPNKTYSLSG
jgi:hypothetical protein